MPDILRITTPLLPNNLGNTIKPDQQQPGNVFNLVDLTRVVKHDQKNEYTDNGNTLLENPSIAEKTFFNLIKEPNMAADALRKLFTTYLSAMNGGKNTTVDVQSFQRLYSSLTLNVDGVLQEMFNQANGISMFKGDFFDVLRKLLAGNLNIKGQDQSLIDAIIANEYKGGESQPAKGENVTNMLANTLFASKNKELTNSIVELIKAFGYRNSAKDVMNSIVSNLRFLGNIMPEKSQLQLQIQDTIRQFMSAVPYGQNWGDVYKQLNSSLVNVLSTLDSSIFKTSRSENLSSLLLFNLSFLNSAEVNVDKSFNKLLSQLKDGEFKDNLKAAFENLMQNIDKPESNEQKSTLIENISKFINDNYRGSEQNTIANSEINNILRSLIAAPNSFTPLQHYVLPLKYMDTQGFAELWVDPNEQRPAKGGGIDSVMHLFFAVDVQPAGYFEVDMLVDEYKINASVLCPPGYSDKFRNLKSELLKLTANSPYTFENLNVDKLVKPKLLAGVFDKLSKKRAGFNVKI